MVTWSGRCICCFDHPKTWHLPKLKSRLLFPSKSPIAFQRVTRNTGQWPHWMSQIFPRKHGMKIQKSSINHQRLLAFFWIFSTSDLPGWLLGPLVPWPRPRWRVPRTRANWPGKSMPRPKTTRRDATAPWGARRRRWRGYGWGFYIMFPGFSFFSILGWLCNISNYVIYIYILYIQNYVYIYAYIIYMHTLYIYIYALYTYIYIIYIDTLYIYAYCIYIYIIYNTLYTIHHI